MIMELAIAMTLLTGMPSAVLTPAKEAGIITKVAEQYKLDKTQTKLLFCIRRVEDGGPGVEFGVGHEDPNHPAHRMQSDPEASLRLQAEWAAGTISKRYTGDLARFAQHWCPRNWESWLRNIEWYMGKGEK